MAKTNAPTMKDVAKEAGVSLGTVSKVINGITVREEYKKKVEAAIASLHYEINTYARRLKTKKSRTSCRDYSQHAKSFFCSPYRLY